MLVLFLGVAILFPNLAFASSAFCADLFEKTNPPWELPLVRASVRIDGRTVYYEHLKAKNGRPTVLVFSGLFTPLSDFAAFQATFARQSRGEGLIIMAYSTQIESMIWSSLAHGVRPEFKDLSLDSFVREATAVLNQEGVRSPIAVAGYSFGSAPASRFAQFHRDRVSDLIFIGPLVSPGDHNSQVHTTKELFESMAVWGFIYGRTMIESMRNSAANSTATSIVNEFLHRQKMPDGVSKAEAIDALAAQIRTAEGFDLRLEDPSLWPRTSFLYGQREAHTRAAFIRNVIEGMQETPAMGEVNVIPGAPHTVLGSSPRAAVEFILRTLRSPRTP